MRAIRLLRIGLTVHDLGAAESFYTSALGFRRTGDPEPDPVLSSLSGAHVRRILLQRGGQALELAQFDPPGAPYPPDRSSNDLWFQHCALVTDDIEAAYASLREHSFTPISRNGPQRLPGGIVAYKFRDPEGHPLELIQFPHPDPATAGGIDHSAIAVADAERSIAFYVQELGLRVQARQVNTGPGQDALDGLADTRVDVVALAAEHPAPHIELLGYRVPQGRPAPPMRPMDIAATRLVLASTGASTVLTRDPDGHALLLHAGGFTATT